MNPKHPAIAAAVGASKASSDDPCRSTRACAAGNPSTQATGNPSASSRRRALRVQGPSAKREARFSRPPSSSTSSWIFADSSSTFIAAITEATRGGAAATATDRNGSAVQGRATAPPEPQSADATTSQNVAS